MSTDAQRRSVFEGLYATDGSIQNNADALDVVVGSGGGGSSSIGSPLDVPGCGLWLDASQIVGINDGDPLPLWSDLSGNNRHAGNKTELQTLDNTGATNGSYKLLDPLTSDPSALIAWNASAATVQAQIEAMPSIGAGNALVTKTAQVYMVRMIATGVAFGTSNDTQDVPTAVTLLTGATTDKGTNPIYIVNGRNGLAVVRFDVALKQCLALSSGLDLLRDCPGATVVIAGNQQMLFVVYDPFYASTANSVDQVRFGMNDGQPYADPNDTGTPTICGGGIGSFTGIPWAAFLWFSNFVDGAVFPSINSFMLQTTDSGAYIFKQDSPFAPVDLSADANSLVIQIARNGAANYADGDLGEIAVWPRALKQSERRQVLEYIADKWNTL